MSTPYPYHVRMFTRSTIMPFNVSLRSKTQTPASPEPRGSSGNGAPPKSTFPPRKPTELWKRGREERRRLCQGV